MAKKSKMGPKRNANGSSLTSKKPAHLAALAKQVASGETLDSAAKNLGISALQAERIVEHPAFATSLMAALYTTLSGSLAPKALKVLDDLLSSKDERIKLSAAKTVIDKALPNVRTDDSAEKTDDLEAMSVSELAHLVDKLEGELSSRATDVTPDNAPVKQSTPAQAVDFME